MIHITQCENPFESDFFKVQLTINDQSWFIFIDDEYHDFMESNQLICLFLVLMALENYDDSEDYLDWCKENALDSTNLVWLNYYKSLEGTYNELEKILGTIDTCISPFEYYMGMAIADEMREHKF